MPKAPSVLHMPVVSAEHLAFQFDARRAKTMVVDGETLVVGTFNLDPRSSNLNTECITIVSSEPLAQGVLEKLYEEMRPENAWRTTLASNPDGAASLWKQLQLLLNRVVPTAIL